MDGPNHYDPFTGRWTAPDPLGDAGGDPDWYGYCLDDPVNGVDPLGLFFSAINARDYMEAASYLNGISWGGTGRSILDGPKIGNWGGKNHSGGVDGGKVGDAKPVDSADESYKRHDLNYEKIKNTPILGDVNKAQKKLKKQADKQLVNELKAMGDDPGKWDNPPTKQNENSSKLFRKGAVFWF